MKQDLIKTGILLCAIFVALAFDISHQRVTDNQIKILSKNYAEVARRAEVIEKRSADLAGEASKWKALAEQVPGRHAPPTESRHAMANRARAKASDILDFANEKEMSLPTTILVSVPGGEETMRRNSQEISRYVVAALTEFLKQFGGPVNGLIRETRPYLLDTSQLQRHVATVNNILVMRLIANDLNNLADQLDPPVIRRQRPAPDPRHEPEVRSTAAAGQE